MELFPPIILALLLNRVRSARIKRNAQLVFYLPYFISTIVLAGMIRLFFSPVGPINAIFGTSIDFMSELNGSDEACQSQPIGS